jgi:hypothetical protein
MVCRPSAGMVGLLADARTVKPILSRMAGLSVFGDRRGTKGLERSVKRVSTYHPVHGREVAAHETLSSDDPSSTIVLHTGWSHEVAAEGKK